MKKLWMQWRFAVGLWLWLGLVPLCAGQAYQFDQNSMLFSTSPRGVNYLSRGGSPLSSTLSNPLGSNGRAPQSPTPSLKQFAGLISYGAVAASPLSLRASLTPNKNYAQNAVNLDLVRNASGPVTMVLTRATIGAPYFSRPVAYLLGDIVMPPVDDERGQPLLTTAPKDYWAAEPSSLDNHASATYYWSPHAQAVFAVQSGPISVTWRKKKPENSSPSNTSGYYLNDGYYYALKTVKLVISSSAVKTPRKMFWTEETFSDLGKLVTIPRNRISSVNVLYSSRFPERVENAYVALGQTFVTPNANERAQETRTLWYDDIGGQLHAYNQEGRVFIELLGDQIDQTSFRHLGFEIIDVARRPFPTEVTTELGEIIMPSAAGIPDPRLLAQPLRLESPFLHQQNKPNQSKSDYYAVRETVILNDVLVHWTEEGIQGIQWPYIFSRYKFVWPDDIAKYSHFVRPSVTTQSAAELTSIALPTKNIPAIQYQDPLDHPRAFLTDNARFYTYLNSTYPAHRTLLRYLSGGQVAFERVFSWLDVNLVNKNFKSSIATNLTGIYSFYNNAYTTNAAMKGQRDAMVRDHDAFKVLLAGYRAYESQTNALGNFLTQLPGFTDQRAAHWSYVEHLRDYNANGMHWDSVGSLAEPRRGSTATLLKDGRVLVAGGTTINGTALQTAQIYDPATKTWSVTGNLTTGRYSHTATLLADGNVLVVGGADGSYTSLRTAELYDSADGVWRSTTSMIIDRMGATATQLEDGNVILIGGISTVEDRAVNEVEIYHPANKGWTSAASQSTGLTEHGVTLLGDGQILVTGGRAYSGGYHVQAQLYSPIYNTWTAVDNLPTARALHTSTLLQNGQVLITGGTSMGESALSTAILYNPTDKTWTATPPLPFPRMAHTANKLWNGQVLISQGKTDTWSWVGGEADYCTGNALYDPQLNLWMTTLPSGTTRIGGTSVLLIDGNVLNVGGFNHLGPVGSVELGTMPPALVQAPSPLMVADQSQAALSNPSIAFANYTNQLANYRAYTNQLPGLQSYPGQLANYNTYISNLVSYNAYTNNLALYNIYTSDLASYNTYTNQLASYNTYTNQLASYDTYTNQLAAYNTYTSELAAYNTYTSELAAYNTYPSQLAAYNTYTNQLALYKVYTNQLADFTSYPSRLAAYSTYTNQLANYDVYWAHSNLHSDYTNKLAAYNTYTNQLAAYNTYTNQLAAYNTYTNQLLDYNNYTNKLLAYNTYTNQLAAYNTYTNQLPAYTAYTNQLVAYNNYTNQLADYTSFTNQLADYTSFTNQLAAYNNYTNQLVAYNNYTNQLAEMDPSRGLIGYWKLNEGQGDLAYDSSTNGLTGTLNGGVSWEAGGATFSGQATNAARFVRTAESSQYISTPHAPAFDTLLGNFSIEAWIYPVPGSLALTIIDKGYYNFAFQAFNVDNPDGGLSFYNHAFSPNGSWIHSTSALPRNAWTHVAVTWNDWTHELIFYANGVATDVRWLPNTWFLWQTQGPLNIGRQSPDTCACNSFDGMLAEVKLFNIARLTSQIALDSGAPAVQLPLVTQPDFVSQPVEVINPLVGSSNGLVGYWKLNEGQGGLAYDSSTNGLTGTLNGGVSWEAGGATFSGQATNAARFVRTAESSQYISTSHPTAFDTLYRTFSIEAWIHPVGGSGSLTIIDQGAEGYNFAFQAFNDTNPHGGLSFYNKAFTSDGSWIHSTSALPRNAWTHVAVTWNWLTHELIFYANGVATDVRSFPNVWYLQLNQGPLNIGRQSPDNCACNSFDGMLAEVKLFNIVRTTSQIALDSRLVLRQPQLVTQPDFVSQPVEVINPSVVSSKGLVGYWKLNESQGDVAVDSGPNGLHGTLNGGVSWQAGGATFAAQATNAVRFTGTDQWEWQWQWRWNEVTFTSEWVNVLVINQENAQFISTPNDFSNAFYSLRHSFSIEAWIHPVGESDSLTIVDKLHSNFAFQDYNPENGYGRLSFYNSFLTSDGTGIIHSTRWLPRNQWTHVAVTWNYLTHEFTFFANGVATDTYTFPNVSRLNLDVGPFTIGRQDPVHVMFGGMGNSFHGMLAEVKLFNTTRPASQIALDSNSEVLPTQPETVFMPSYVMYPYWAPRPSVVVIQPEFVTQPSTNIPEYPSEISLPAAVTEPTVAVAAPGSVLTRPEVVSRPATVLEPQLVNAPAAVVIYPQVATYPTSLVTSKPLTVVELTAAIQPTQVVARPVAPAVPSLMSKPASVLSPIAVAVPTDVPEPPPLPGWPSGFTAPQVISEQVAVGDRILAPVGELGSGQSETYFAGYIRQENGDSFHSGAYRDPFILGFDQANQGAIIPVNAIPGRNTLEVWWFRVSATNEIKNAVNNFGLVHWPAVIGRYTLVWPSGSKEIVLANNEGSGGLNSLQAKGTIYTQNNPEKPGYNPNEEHALMLEAKVYALRDDLNLTGTSTSAVLVGPGVNYSSAPYVLLDYIESDGRPAVRTFEVLREKPEVGELFDYVMMAGGSISESGKGKILQAPMPLPFLPPPVDVTGLNHNIEPTGTVGDLPVGWQESMSTTYSNYNKFTFEDRKHNFWVLRGLHSGLPDLQAGTYNAGSGMFEPNLPAAFAVVGKGFTNTFHTSRLPDSLVVRAAALKPLPKGLHIEGTSLIGSPTEAGVYPLEFVITDNGDEASVRVTLSLTVFAENKGYVHEQQPIRITLPSTSLSAAKVFVGRPPFLANTPIGNNSFTMRFYYKTQEGFAWPGFASAPANGSIVPYLRPMNASGQFVGAADQNTTESLGIVYRPVWPGNPPKLRFGETLMTPKNNMPAVRGQTSVQILYQQAIAKTITNPTPAVTLHDPTREKSFAFNAIGLKKIPDGVRTQYYQGKTYFPNLPPHLAKRVFFDPNRGTLGHLVVKGEFRDELMGEDYLMLNVLSGTDLEYVKALCPSDPLEDKTLWDSAVDALITAVHTYYENPLVPGKFITNDESTFRSNVGIGDLPTINHSDTAVDSYALSASGPGRGYVTMIVGNGNAYSTPKGEPVSVYVLKVDGPLYPGELKIIPSDNPLSELVSFQHTADLAGKYIDYEYEWKMSPPVDGGPPRIDSTMSLYQPLTNGLNIPRYTLGGSGVQALVDNYIVMRYRPMNRLHPLYQSAPAASASNWSAWTEPQLAEGWIKRVLAGINPFGQRVTDLFNHGVNTDANILTSAGKRWEGDIALNLANIDDSGLIEIYETVLRRGKGLSIDAGINFGPANDALLLAAGYLNDLYIMVGNEAYADASNPTIGIGTKDKTYGDIATALFSFKGQLPTLLEEELALLRGRDDVLQPGVQTAPVYNRLVWNYTRGIDSGEVIYALNYNILDQNTDGKVDAADAAKLFPQGHGDAYGHYLTAMKGYYLLLLNNKFDWVPRSEAVTVLGKPVSVDYLDERKFASSAAAVARTGRQIFDLTWRQSYVPGQEGGWDRLSETRVSTREVLNGSDTNKIVRHWGADQWASRTMQGAYLNWVVGNALLPSVDPDPSHQGIQKVDRSTVPELTELPTTAADLQAALDNAEGRLTPLGLAEGSIPFDINPISVIADPQTHFEQVFGRALGVLNNAVSSFDDAKDVTRLMRSEQDSLTELQLEVKGQELAYKNSLIELYGTPYTDDIGPGKTYLQGYDGPDLIHYTYTDKAERVAGNELDLTNSFNLSVDTQNLPVTWMNAVRTTLDGFVTTTPANKVVSIYIDTKVPFAKPPTWSGKRSSPGAIQQSISEYTAARNTLYQSLSVANRARNHLLKSVVMFNEQIRILGLIKANDNTAADKEYNINDKTATMATQEKWLDVSAEILGMAAQTLVDSVPDSSIFGLANGGDIIGPPARGAIWAGFAGAKAVLLLGGAGAVQQGNNEIVEYQKTLRDLTKDNVTLQLDLETKNAVFALEEELDAYQANLWSINERLREFDDADRAYRSLVAQGDRLQNEREVYRQRAAAVVQGFRTRDAGFRIFRNEKLERYKTLFDLAARYAYMAATAYDYETGLLNTTKGKAFINRIVSSRALGMVKDGVPQYAGSNTGDPGLSSALAEMKADWDVLKGRLGFNNPDTYGTTVSLRTENLRILPGTEGDPNWKDILSRSQMDNLLDDPDIRRQCLQIDIGNGLPVPGIVLSFSTTVDAGKNLFGHPLAARDQGFDVSSFATKIFSMGVVLEGYLGMNNPESNTHVIDTAGGGSPTDPSSVDPRELSGTPYVYLIPVGVDSMRSPPLGDQSKIRSWNVNDVAIPLPFNIGGSEFSTKKLYQSAESLAEPLFGVRKHQAFRPVSDPAYFNMSGEGNAAAIQISQFSNRRLIGRSVWNSQWKIVILGRTLLNDPNEGLRRFIDTVKDVKLHFVTYSYSGN